jgi:wobble nucleotide-excising tRNase
MSLDGGLSSKSQNLLFATSGTGKSFLSRAIRLFDGGAADAEENRTNPRNIVSEEGSAGTLELFEGAEQIAKLQLDTKTNQTQREVGKYIFHVYSTDYVNTELGRRQFQLNGDIDHEIILGRENKDLTEKEDQKVEKQKALRSASDALQLKFDNDKRSLQRRLSISGNLSEYNGLKIPLEKNAPARPASLETLANIQLQFDALKSLPSDPALPVYPDTSTISPSPTNLSELLTTPVSASTIAEDVKKKIQNDPDFFERGVEHLHVNSETCPFCTQKIGSDAKATIEAIIAYFEDAEAKAKKELNALQLDVSRTDQAVEKFKLDAASAEARFDNLKKFFPSTQTIGLSSPASKLEEIKAKLHAASQAIQRKLQNLETTDFNEQDFDYAKELSELSRIRERNQGLIQSLVGLVTNSTNERLSIQRKGCTAFRREFLDQYRNDIEAIQNLESDILQLTVDIEALKKSSGEKVSAREKVADTFTYLMRFVFGEKYSFDRARFVVQRNKADMTRGGDRTLSDGEKSILAFCYYLAQTHLKVETAADYERLFFVIDDPVSSVSFDYVYSVCQMIKALRITDGDLLFSGGNERRPNMLILTHHDYFYNVILNNKVIDPSGLFQLISRSGTHEIRSQKQFITPHEFHLGHVKAVALGSDLPCYSTPNSIRSVLEGIWRFSRPDFDQLEKFVACLNDEHDLQIRSVLINDLSHGGKLYVESPLEADIVTAAKEVVEIVRVFAKGQVIDVPDLDAGT